MSHTRGRGMEHDEPPKFSSPTRAKWGARAANCHLPVTPEAGWLVSRSRHSPPPDESPADSTWGLGQVKTSPVLKAKLQSNTHFPRRKPH